MVELYDNFMKIANTTGPGQTVLNLQLGEVTRDKVIKSVGEGSKDANEWAKQVSEYFGEPRTGELQNAMKFFFPGSGFEIEDKIDWKKLKGLLENRDIGALKQVSDEVKPANEMPEVNATLTILGETMLKINKLMDKPEESEKDKKENKRREEVRAGLKENLRSGTRRY